MSTHSESGANNYWRWKKANHKDYPRLSKLLYALYCRASIFYNFCQCCDCSCFAFDLTERLNSFDIIFWRFQSWWRWVKITQYIHFSFDLKMRNWPRHGALISIMSRKSIDAPRDDFPTFPLYVFTVLWQQTLEIALGKNATSLQWYSTVSALWAGLSSFSSFLTLSF